MCKNFIFSILFLTIASASLYFGFSRFVDIYFGLNVYIQPNSYLQLIFLFIAAIIAILFCELEDKKTLYSRWFYKESAQKRSFTQSKELFDKNLSRYEKVEYLLYLTLPCFAFVGVSAILTVVIGSHLQSHLLCISCFLIANSAFVFYRLSNFLLVDFTRYPKSMTPTSLKDF